MFKVKSQILFHKEVRINTVLVLCNVKGKSGLMLKRIEFLFNFCKAMSAYIIFGIKVNFKGILIFDRSDVVAKMHWDKFVSKGVPLYIFHTLYM